MKNKEKDRYFKDIKVMREKKSSNALLGMLLISLGVNIYFLEHMIYDIEFGKMANSLTLQDVILSGRPYHILIIGLLTAGAFILTKELLRILRNK